MAEFTARDIYQAEFDPRAYLEYFNFGGGTLGDEAIEFYLGHFCKTFASGRLKGDTLVDLGSGPTIHQFLSACESFGSIVASEPVDRNRQEIEKWLKNKPGAFDWTPIVKYVCELEGNRDKWAEKEAKLRRTLKQVLDGDVLRSNPLEPVALPQADCLLDVECLEAACKDLSALRAALKNISSLLKLGGTLVSAGVLGCSFYMVGPRKFSFLVLTEEILRDALNTSGFAVVEFQEEPRFAKNMFDVCDFSGKYFLIARKEKEA
ncbi:nicotinamide N-methyltransferase-like isoform X1 [Eublepharis macularius]|uniref:Nicotinamide N-methyltransferase-like isoform X1 n=1 Tax=Eublepharis macularius TaxID=481883 RepID=A0AA97KCT8_EUBMA|nr:nicotinamide N-methyltransferase-like isoform X1 [Eublepharis macularius]